MNVDQLTGILRALLPAVTAYAVGRGWISAGSAGELGAAAITLIAAIWSVWSNKTGKTIA